jgi:hypothetical protein
MTAKLRSEVVKTKAQRPTSCAKDKRLQSNVRGRPSRIRSRILQSDAPEKSQREAQGARLKRTTCQGKADRGAPAQRAKTMSLKE